MRKIIFTFLFYISFASVQAQEWETVAALPSNVNVSQIKVVSEDNIIVSCNQFGLLQWDGESWNDIGEFNSLYTPYFQYFSDNDIYATKMIS